MAVTSTDKSQGATGCNSVELVTARTGMLLVILCYTGSGAGIELKG